MTTKGPTTVDLSKLKDGPATRRQIGATAYAIKQSIAEKTIQACAKPKDSTARGTHYKLTAKGRRRA